MLDIGFCAQRAIKGTRFIKPRIETRVMAVALLRRCCRAFCIIGFLLESEKVGGGLSLAFFFFCTYRPPRRRPRCLTIALGEALLSSFLWKLSSLTGNVATEAELVLPGLLFNLLCHLFCHNKRIYAAVPTANFIVSC